jgi:putative DNA primase/helicase
MSIDETQETYSYETLIDSGFKLVSVLLGEKGPVQTDWNRRENTIGRKSQISELSGMNAGLAHAYCTPNPTCAIDKDNELKAIDWCSRRGVNISELQQAADAVGISSGKPNSSKLIYRLPDGVPALPSIAITDSNSDVILEFRCGTKNGRTVQDLIPPSIHPSGSKYKWTGAGSILNLPIIPARLLSIWQELLDAKNRKIKPKIPYRFSIPETNRQVTIIKHLLSFINADCDYETYRNVVWGIASTGWSCAYQIAHDWSLTAEHRFEEHTLDALFYSYDPDRDDRITVGTIYHYAKQGGA